MIRRFLAVLAALGLACAGSNAVAATGEALEARDIQWSFEGPFGTFNQAQLQRGFKVYREVCASCHSMNLLSFRHLGTPGGPFYDPEHIPTENPYVQAIAREYQIGDIDSETGDPVQRNGTAADRFPNPYPNEAAARAGNGGAYPPDLSVITKARQGGADYIYSILVGYVPPPAGLRVPPGQYYNPYMPGDLTAYWTGDPNHVPPGGFLAMPPPLEGGRVTFDDGRPSTIAQQAIDVTTFLTWASEPTLVDRKRTGFAVMIYLLILAAVLYASYRKIWKNVAH